MRRLISTVVASSALVGCSLIYNPNNLPEAVDAAIDAEPIVPAMLELDGVAPAAIFEGQGDGGSAPAIVVIHGKNIVDSSTVVEIAAATGTAQLALGAPVIANDGHWIAIPVTAHVDATLGKNAVVPLDVKVTQAVVSALGTGSATFTLKDKLSLRGLTELDMNAPEAAGGVIDTDKLEAQYARVDLSAFATTTFKGTAPAVIRSMSSLAARAIDAKGADGAPGNMTGAGGAAKAGGCGGGAAGSDGVGCDAAVAGKKGEPNSVLSGAGGGGGGGFAVEGSSGEPSVPVPGAGGSRTGDALLMRYTGTASGASNRPGGGGGGGKPQVVGSTAGGGGAGGGWISFGAAGDVSVGAITVDGGGGGRGNTAGGGGGGAGGAVVLRAGGTLTSGAISIRGGVGGAGVAGLAANGDGGTGAPGRVRWDVPNGSAPTVMSGTGSNGTVHRGPAFTLASPVFRSATAMISLIGTANDQLRVYTTYEGDKVTDPRTITISSASSPDAVMFPLTLKPGYTRLCVTIDGGVQGADEADKCVDVAYVP